MVKDASNNTVTLTEFLRQNGISLTDTATFTTSPPGVGAGVGILDDAPNSVYQYGENEAAFGLVQDGDDLRLKFLHGVTWTRWEDRAINSPNRKRTNCGPQIVSGGGGLIGTYSVNYRNEPLEVQKDVGRVGTSGSGPQNDMSFAFASIDGRAAPWNRAKPDVQVASADGTVPSLFARPKDPAEINGPWEDPVGFAVGNVGVNDGKISSWDPYTPLLRGYQGDPVQVRALVGAHTQPHSFTIHGVKWLSEMKSRNSGYRNAQEMGISEHFEFEFDLPPASTESSRLFADYLYAPSSGARGQANGVWGIMRSYDNTAEAGRGFSRGADSHLAALAAGRQPASI